ncbi:hypothetical protein CPB84DRAFT_1774397, partial [Gymnopilus junonius]
MIIFTQHHYFLTLSITLGTIGFFHHVTSVLFLLRSFLFLGPEGLLFYFFVIFAVVFILFICIIFTTEPSSSHTFLIHRPIHTIHATHRPAPMFSHVPF